MFKHKLTTIKNRYDLDDECMQIIDAAVEDLHWLACLENAGVDNWNGLEFAQELYAEEQE